MHLMVVACVNVGLLAPNAQCRHQAVKIQILPPLALMMQNLTLTCKHARYSKRSLDGNR